MDAILEQEKKHNRTLYGYVLAFVLLLLSYLLSLYTNNQLEKQSGMVIHTYEVMNDAERLLSEIKDAETGMRGYLISKEKLFLKPYFGSREEVDSILQKLKNTTSDTSTQQQRLSRLEKLIGQRFAIIDFNVNKFGEAGIVTDSMKLIQPGQILLMDSIRTLINDFKAEEGTLLRIRNEKQNATFKTLKIITYTSIILAITLIIFGVFTFIKESRSKTAALLRIKEYQAQLQKKIDEQAETNVHLVKMKSLEKFAATGRIARTIAHEIRNPLTNINLAADQLKEESISDDENARFLFEMITRNSTRINQLISDLLNSTKFSELNYKKVSINNIVDQALTDAEDRIKLFNIRVEKRYSQDICDISVDDHKLKIALLNVIINAIEAMEETNGPVLIIQTRVSGDYCIVQITDNGPGIDKESLSRIFDPYFTNKKKGNGLGLTNTQNIILNHKGEISVESEPGQGTTFSISLLFN